MPKKKKIDEIEDAKELNKRGNAYNKKGEYDRAIDCYKKALAIKPDYHQAWYNMALTYEKKGKYDRAIDCYEKALELKPDKYEAWNNMGSAYFEKGELDRAIECFQKALAIKPDKHLTWYNLGMIYREKGEFYQAIECFQKALAIKPNYHLARNNLAIAKKELKAKMLEELPARIRRIHEGQEIALSTVAKEYHCDESLVREVFDQLIDTQRIQGGYKDISSSDIFIVGSAAQTPHTPSLGPDRFCFNCGSPLAPGKRTCSNCCARCEICKMALCKGQEIALCPYCERGFHYSHLMEWIKTRGRCPVCKKKLKVGWFSKS